MPEDEPDGDEPAVVEGAVGTNVAEGFERHELSAAAHPHELPAPERHHLYVDAAPHGVVQGVVHDVQGHLRHLGGVGLERERVRTLWSEDVM